MKTLRIVCVLAIGLFLAACDSIEDRIDEHFQSGVSLIESGENEKALVEFRNVFQLDGGHREARQIYAKTVREMGRDREAYSQYLRLVEQYPDDKGGRLALAQMAFANRNWEEFLRHGAVVNELNPDVAENIELQAVAVGVQYVTAMRDEDGPAREAVVLDIEELAQSPEGQTNSILRNLLIDGYSQAGAYEKALTLLNTAIEVTPADRQLYDIRLSILGRLQDAAAIELHLKDVMAAFPEDEEAKLTLIRLYLSQGEQQKAEDFMRETSDPSAEDLQPFMTLVRFISQTQGAEAALEELERGLQENPTSMPLNAVRAGIKFNIGEQDEAIADLEALLEDADTSAEALEAKTVLANLLLRTDNKIGSRRVVEEVLEADPGQEGALKMQARWLIDADDVDGAIIALRRALDSNPEDTAAMTLMAEAHARAGRRELQRDLLSLAADTSSHAPNEAIRYATALIEDERFAPAEDTLLASLRTAPNNTNVLRALGGLYLRTEDAGRLQQVIDTLRRAPGGDAVLIADTLEASLLSRSRSTEEMLALIESIQERDGANIQTHVAVIQTHLMAGDLDKGLAHVEEQLREDPASPQFLFLKSALLGASGQLVESESILRELIVAEPSVPQFWLEMVRVLSAQARHAEARAMIDEGLAANPDQPTLLWAKASALERDGNFDGAIEVYEALYAQSSTSLVVANNLSSLLSTYRTDEASHERAFVVGRRLRGTEVPAMQDTYGWLMYRDGNFTEALEYLEPAAVSLGRDPIVQYHLGMTYLALERLDEALEQFTKAVTLAGEADTRAQVVDARLQISTLRETLSQN